MRLLCIILLSFLLTTAVYSAPVQANTTMKDVMVAVRTLGFVENPPQGPVDFAVIYDPTKEDSINDKDNTYAVLDGGTPVGPAIIRTVPITISELSRLKEFKFILLTAGIDKIIPKITELTKNTGILTISTNLDYVRKGQCVLGIVSEPMVKVLINRDASNNNGISFAVFFRMMITEIGE